MNETDSDADADADADAEGDDVSEGEELMTAEEFFKEAECPKCGKDPCECPVNEKESDDSDMTKDDKELAESLKAYRKNNARLFNA